MQQDPRARAIALAGLLVVVWIVTYWLYEPGEPPVTFGERPAGLEGPEPPAGAGAGPQPRQDAPVDGTAIAPPPIAAEAPPQDEAEGSAERSARVIPPQFREVTVQRGDISWEAIAQRVYGDRRRWQAIAKANPYVTPDKLFVGRTRLLVPLDPENIQGVVIDADGSAQAGRPSDAPSPPQQEYVIAANDTLSGIAKSVYGKAALWRRIYEANRDKLPNPDRLPVGVTIRIPPPAPE
jgi:nucleoid-associated protein YgaU